MPFRSILSAVLIFYNARKIYDNIYRTCNGVRVLVRVRLRRRIRLRVIIFPNNTVALRLHGDRYTCFARSESRVVCHRRPNDEIHYWFCFFVS